MTYQPTPCHYCQQKYQPIWEWFYLVYKKGSTTEIELCVCACCWVNYNGLYKSQKVDQKREVERQGKLIEEYENHWKSDEEIKEEAARKHPPWYKSWWARGIGIAFGVVLLLWLILYLLTRKAQAFPKPKGFSKPKKN